MASTVGMRLLATSFIVQIGLALVVFAGDEPFSFDDIFDPRYRPVSFSGQWIDGTNDFLYRNYDSGALMRFNAVTKEQTVFVDNSTFFTLKTSTYFVSPNYQYVLFAYDTASLWRHSFYAKYKILDVATKNLIDFPNGEFSGRSLQYANWGPNGALTFVVGNNLYYQRTPQSNPEAITTNGNPTWIYNGVPDWLYEEDVLSDRVSHYFSPSGRYLVYAELNDTQVPLQAWPWYGSKNNVYDATIHIPYPKAGDIRDGKPGPNTIVTLYVVDTTTMAKKHIPPVSNLVGKDHYYLQVAWRDDSRTVITWANRVQNESWAAVYDVTQPSLTPFVNYHQIVSGGWIEVPPATPWFIDAGENYLTILPELVSESSGSWRHLALVTSAINGAGTATFLMQGEEEVDYIVGYDDPNKTVYYISTGGDAAERHLYMVVIGVNVPQCLTCGQPASCRYVTTQFSSNYLYYILGCRGPEIPTYTLRERLNENAVYMLENNDVLRANLELKALPTREFITFPINDGYTGRAEVFYPPNYEPGNRYPVLVYAYGGPGSQRVMKTFPMGSNILNWLTYLKSTHNVVVASLDGRGTAAAGDKLKFEMYRKLSVVEIEDQNTGGQYFASQDYADPSLPLGIFGWSYGGGVAAHLIGDPSATFKCGISVAPVTTKAYYDTAYTERYLGFATADDDEEGYDATDVMNKVQNFRDKTFLIAHGSADDNVHYMHAAQLIRALANAGIQFRQNMYVDQNHNINSPGQSRHLFATLTNFLLNDCWSARKRNIVPYSSAPSPHTRATSLLLVPLTSLVVFFTRHLL